MKKIGVAITTYNRPEYFKQCIDSMPEVRELRKLDFMKIDIEGFEYKALLGATNTIKKHKPDMLIEIHTWDNYEGVYGLLKEIDYKFFDLEMNKIKLSTHFPHQIFHIYVTTKST